MGGKIVALCKTIKSNFAKNSLKSFFTSSKFACWRKGCQKELVVLLPSETGSFTSWALGGPLNQDFWIVNICGNFHERNSRLTK